MASPAKGTIAAVHFSPDALEFIRLLGKHRVEFVIVGGEAVIYHGYARFTGDVDFFFTEEAPAILRLCIMPCASFGAAGFHLSKQWTISGKFRETANHRPASGSNSTSARNSETESEFSYGQKLSSIATTSSVSRTTVARTKHECHPTIPPLGMRTSSLSG